MKMKYLLKRLLAPVLYRVPVSGLQPERQYVYMNEVWKRRKQSGVILEVGCNLGGTAAIVYQMMERTGFEKKYICIDTFSGFKEKHFEQDMRIGTPKERKRSFSTNSIELVRKLLDSYECEKIDLIQADIAAIEESDIPDNILVCLLDVDLELPTYEGLKKIYNKIVKGGAILIDDCLENYTWAGAIKAYKSFTKEINLKEKYINGVGIIEKSSH